MTLKKMIINYEQKKSNSKVCTTFGTTYLRRFEPYLSCLPFGFLLQEEQPAEAMGS